MKYQPRPIKFIEVHQVNEWYVKIYSISDRRDVVDLKTIENAKAQLSTWLHLANANELEKHSHAVLILHEGKEGCFAIINWWIDYTMLQHYVYLALNEKPEEFQWYSKNGIITCVWELAVIWFERNAWVEYYLTENDPKQKRNNYLNCVFNGVI